MAAIIWCVKKKNMMALSTLKDCRDSCSNDGVNAYIKQQTEAMCVLYSSILFQRLQVRNSMKKRNFAIN